MGRYLDILVAVSARQEPRLRLKTEGVLDGLNAAETLGFLQKNGHDRSTLKVTTKVLPPVIETCSAAVFLDFETRNTGGCKLKEAGAWRYAGDPATEILTLVYRNGDAEPRVWTPEQGWCEHLASLALDPAAEFTSFGDFEQVVWDRIMVPRFGFPGVPLARWSNAQAICSAFALPRTLGKVLPVIGADVVKDDAGRRLVLSLSRPHRKTGKYPEVTPEVRERVAAYNKIDVEALIAIHERAGSLSERERRVWELDQVINRRGVRIDTEFVHAARHLAEVSRETLFAEFADLTKDPELKNDPGLSPYQVGKTKEWLKSKGFAFPNLEGETIEEALDTLVLPDDVRRVLEIRLITAPTSLKKLDAMLACVGRDGRARGLFRYHAATPGRWSAALIQPQNLPRPLVDIAPGDIEELVAAVKTENPMALARWGAPLDVLMSSLRFALVADEGKQFGVGDFAMIETCILLALAGQHDKCKLIAEGVDIYRDAAVPIYGLDREAFMAISKDGLTLEQDQQRATGKTTVLGCGYGMGADRFQRQYCRHMPKEEGAKFARGAVHTYRKVWAPRVPKLWYDLERTARHAMLRPGIRMTAECGISYQLEQKAGLPCLTCRLLNGKEIFYINAKVSSERVDRRGYPVWTYWAYRNGQWRENEPYGSQLTENVVQALARELLVEAMLRFEARGFPVVMHCHDEIGVEHAEITASMMQEIMAERPQWAAELGVPVGVEAWIGGRYRK
jgi:DNA polymerase